MLFNMIKIDQITLLFLLLQTIQMMPFVPLMVTKTVPPKTQNNLKVSVKKSGDYDLITKRKQEKVHVLVNTMK